PASNQIVSDLPLASVSAFRLRRRVVFVLVRQYLGPTPKTRKREKWKSCGKLAVLPRNHLKLLILLDLIV
ncbi:hypothetical protein, partial [Pararhodobacter oceanensis]|uniref:hypothetical protein n=1 Tax=Pararhodobacter oceanensis TaxID=2172121 RepID=UPI003A8F3CB2